MARKGAPPTARPLSPPSAPRLTVPSPDDTAAMHAWLRRQLAGETPLQVQGEPGVRPWRGVPIGWLDDARQARHAAFVREHVEIVRGVLAGAPLPQWLRSRWLDHLAALSYASRSSRGRARLLDAERESASADYDAE